MGLVCIGSTVHFYGGEWHVDQKPHEIKESLAGLMDSDWLELTMSGFDCGFKVEDLISYGPIVSTPNGPWPADVHLDEADMTDAESAGRFFRNLGS